MADSMVTGRVPAQKKAQAVSILQHDGLTASQAINLMFNKLISEQSASFLKDEASDTPTPTQWQSAARFIDAIPTPRSTRFDAMTRQEAKMDRLRSRGLA